MKRVKLGLVLSGGGSRGAYEIGVYKALKKLGFNFDIIVGTSIGALNGAVLTEGDYKLAYKLWRHLSFSSIYDTSIDSFDYSSLSSIYKSFLSSFIHDGGMDTSKINYLVRKILNPSKFFKSSNDYGLITYNLSRLEPVIMKKNDLNADNLCDYVLASCSCYPAFKPFIINGDKYIDGGYYDNLPLNLCASMGADEIIAVDLKSVGLKRKLEKSIPVTIISPRNKIQSFLVFDGKLAKKAIKFGYNDAMKTMGRLDGDFFTFKKGSLARNYVRYGDRFIDDLKSFFGSSSNVISDLIVKSSLFKDFMDKRVTYNRFNYVIQLCGRYFSLDESRVYDIMFYNFLLRRRLRTFSSISKSLLLSDITSNDIKSLKKDVSNGAIVSCFYDYIINNDVSSVLKLLPFFVKEFLAAFYVYIISMK